MSSRDVRIVCPRPYSCPILTKLVLFRQIFETCSNIKFHENLSSGSLIVPCGQTEGWTDLIELIVVFRSFANAHYKGLKYSFLETASA
jgi:hypothetical protein